MEYSLTESLEDYLLEIFILSKEKGIVRIKDIAKRRHVKLPSVVSALKELSKRALINHEKYGYVALTEAGFKEAKRVYERHKTIYKFLHEILGIEEEIAEKDAHKMEHDLNKQTIELLTKFIEFVEKNPVGDKPRWLEHFRYFVKTGKFPETECKKGGKKTMERNLSELKVGEEGRILRIKSGIGALKTKLLDMGAIPGTVVKVEKVAPLGDPIDILILGYHLSLRREEAEKIVVEKI